MRLWHQKLIPFLDNKRLLGQHRECCALRGKGWKKKHSVVDYVFTYDLAHLYAYHICVINELIKRGYHIDSNWYLRIYRGKNLPCIALSEVGTFNAFTDDNNSYIYKEHGDKYLKECLLNLWSKGAELINGQSLEKMLVELDLNDS